MTMTAAINRNEAGRIEALLWRVMRSHDGSGSKKTSKSQVEPKIIAVLETEGYRVDPQDVRGLYPKGVPPWRVGDGSLAAPTRRMIDVVVYDSRGQLAALIESEDNIGNVTLPTFKPQRYAVRSLARDAAGRYFDSYQSIERMAVAAFAAAKTAMDPTTFIARLEQIRSDSPTDHNPGGLPMFLTLARGSSAGRTAAKLTLLEARLRSIACRVIAV